MSISYIFIDHALQRASERFPEMTVEELTLYAESSKVARNKTKKRLNEACPYNYDLHHKGGFKDRYYLYNSKKNIAFVVGNRNEIITLFPFEKG